MGPDDSHGSNAGYMSRNTKWLLLGRITRENVGRHWHGGSGDLQKTFLWFGCKALNTRHKNFNRILCICQTQFSSCGPNEQLLNFIQLANLLSKLTVFSWLTETPPFPKAILQFFFFFYSIFMTTLETRDQRNTL